jgi:hypothetical protein
LGAAARCRRPALSRLMRDIKHAKARKNGQKRQIEGKTRQTLTFFDLVEQ